MKDGGYSDVIVYHIHQAVEKYLKGFMLSKGWRLRKIHDLETLLTEANEYDAEVEAYLDFGRKLTAYYYEERYPPGPPSKISDDTIKELLVNAENLIEKIKEGVCD